MGWPVQEKSVVEEGHSCNGLALQGMTGFDEVSCGTGRFSFPGKGTQGLSGPGKTRWGTITTAWLPRAWPTMIIKAMKEEGNSMAYQVPGKIEMEEWV